jgi:hypothetical protein
LAVWAIATLLILAAAQTDQTRLQAGIQKEVVEGDLAGAMQIYESLAKSNDRAVAAKALLRLARCHEKAGDGQAAKVYERITKEFADQPDSAAQATERLAQLTPSAAETGAVTAWYNGDWQSGIPGLANWYISEDESSRVYDDFVVPEGGWTVVGLFSNNRMDFSGVTHAAWEIRSGVSPDGGGRRVAGGVARATQKLIPGNGPFPKDPLIGYRIEVDGLHIQLPPGHYWMSVAPVGVGTSFASATRGSHAIGRAADTPGAAYFRSAAGWRTVEEMAAMGQMGRTRHFSVGVLVKR